MRRRRAAERDRAAKPLRDVLDQRLGRQFLDKARRDRACHWPGCGGFRRSSARPVARPRDADIGKPAFLLQPDGAILVDGALAREDPLLPSGHEDMSNSSPFAA